MLRAVEDKMLNQLILESLIQKGSTNIEESEFMRQLVESILKRTFSDDIKNLEESLQYIQRQSYQPQVQPQMIQNFSNQNNELNESDFVSYFVKKF